MLFDLHQFFRAKDGAYCRIQLALYLSDPDFDF